MLIFQFIFPTPKKTITLLVQWHVQICIVQTYLDLLDAIAGFSKDTATLIVIIVE